MVLQSLVHPIRTLEELNKQRDISLFTDVTVIVSGEKFPAHRSLLAAHSPVFRSVWESSADKTPTIQVDGVDSDIFSIVIDFIYTAKLMINLNNVEQVSTASSFLQITSVVDLCSKFKEANKRATDSGTCDKPVTVSPSLKKSNVVAENAVSGAETLSPPKQETHSQAMEEDEVEQGQIEVEISEAEPSHVNEELVVNSISSYPSEEDMKDLTKKPKRNNRYECHICQKVMTGFKLEAHLRTHTGEKPFHCALCQRPFASIYNLRIHERIHTGEKPHKCTICDRAFSDPSSLSKHKLWHAGKKTKKCPVCSRLFSTVAQVKDHMRTHTKERPFECPHCNKCYAYRCDLKRHLREHTGNLFGPCEYCGRYFNHRGNYKVHLRSHEKKEAKLGSPSFDFPSKKNDILEETSEESFIKVDDFAKWVSEGHSIEVTLDGKLLMKPSSQSQSDGDFRNDDDSHAIVMSQEDELVAATVTLQRSMARHNDLMTTPNDVMRVDSGDALVIADQVIDLNN